MHYSFLTGEQPGLRLLLKPCQFSPPSVMCIVPLVQGKCAALIYKGKYGHVRGLGAW